MGNEHDLGVRIQSDTPPQEPQTGQKQKVATLTVHVNGELKTLDIFWHGEDISEHAQYRNADVINNLARLLFHNMDQQQLDYRQTKVDIKYQGGVQERNFTMLSAEYTPKKNAPQPEKTLPEIEKTDIKPDTEKPRQDWPVFAVVDRLAWEILKAPGEIKFKTREQAEKEPGLYAHVSELSQEEMPAKVSIRGSVHRSLTEEDKKKLRALKNQNNQLLQDILKACKKSVPKAFSKKITEQLANLVQEFNKMDDTEKRFFLKENKQEDNLQTLNQIIHNNLDHDSLITLQKLAMLNTYTYTKDFSISPMRREGKVEERYKFKDVDWHILYLKKTDNGWQCIREENYRCEGNNNLEEDQLQEPQITPREGEKAFFFPDIVVRDSDRSIIGVDGEIFQEEVGTTRTKNIILKLLNNNISPEKIQLLIQYGLSQATQGPVVSQLVLRELEKNIVLLRTTENFREIDISESNITVFIPMVMPVLDQSSEKTEEEKAKLKIFFNWDVPASFENEKPPILESYYSQI